MKRENMQVGMRVVVGTGNSCQVYTINEIGESNCRLEYPTRIGWVSGGWAHFSTVNCPNESQLLNYINELETALSNVS